MPSFRLSPDEFQHAKDYLANNDLTIKEKIGGGGHGIVYLARCNQLNADVAVKISVNKRSNRKEAEVAKAMCHVRIIETFRTFSDQQFVYVVQSRAERDLESITHSRSPPLPLANIKSLAGQLVEALQYIHGQGWAHMDLKGANVLLNRGQTPGDWLLFVTDFGLSIRFMQDGRAIRARRKGGEAYPYWPVELLIGEPFEPPKVDIYSLGALLYSMFQRNLPTGNLDSHEAVVHAMRTRCYRANLSAAGLPSGLFELLDSMLSPVADQRPSLASIAAHPWLATFADGGVMHERAVHD